MALMDHMDDGYKTPIEVDNLQRENAIIADLSQHADKLMQYDDIAHLLSDEQEKRLVNYVETCLDVSHRKIEGRYPYWQEADNAHDVYVRPETTDFREKAVIPVTRAIADTVLTYFMAAITGRNPIFQLQSLNRQSDKSTALLEQVLHQQMRRTGGVAQIHQ